MPRHLTWIYFIVITHNVRALISLIPTDIAAIADTVLKSHVKPSLMTSAACLHPLLFESLSKILNKSPVFFRDSCVVWQFHFVRSTFRICDMAGSKLRICSLAGNRPGICDLAGSRLRICD